MQVVPENSADSTQRSVKEYSCPWGVDVGVENTTHQRQPLSLHTYPVPCSQLTKVYLQQHRLPLEILAGINDSMMCLSNFGIDVWADETTLC